MTDTEKILNLLEINETIPSLVTDEERKIISSNQAWANNLGQAEIGKSFNRLFDKNTSLLIKNSFIDAKAFLKIQRREVSFVVDNKKQNYKLLLSPFKLKSKLYVYALLYDDSQPKELLVYPSLDVGSISAKYEEIITQLQVSFPSTLIEKKNLQYAIDIEKESIALKDKYQFLFTNNSFNRELNIQVRGSEYLSPEKVFASDLLSKIKLAENELYITNSSFVIEGKNFTQSALKHNNRILLYPIIKKTGQIENMMIIGSIEEYKNDTVNQINESDNDEHKTVDSRNESISLEESEHAKIIYDRNDFDVLDANLAASELYGYELETLKQMNITQLFSPEDMQKLLMPTEENAKHILKQINKDGSTIDVKVERKNILWAGREACEETITLNQPEEEVIKLEEFSEKKIPSVTSDEEVVEPSKTKKVEQMTDFLSSLFHELLTPVNVILGFVQEIVDSIENPTEEQDESAQIIKDNQQVLLQAMNTAVQFAQLDENKIKLNIDEFDVNNYLVDLQDSFSRTSEKENVSVIFDEMPDSLYIKHDRSKLLAAISYFIKFVIKLTDSSKVFVSFKSIGDDFYVLVKDSENGISENVSSDMLEIFNVQLLNGKKNYGISPITLRLAKKINELLSVKIAVHSDPNGVNSVALVASAITEETSIAEQSKTFVENTKSVDEQIVDMHEEVLEKAEPVDTQIAEEVETVVESTESVDDQAIEDIETIDDQIIEQNEKIIEEITEEQATVSEANIGIPVEFISENDEQIPNGEVDNKIVEDIEEEEEIVTEEIATVETINDVIADFSTLTCLFIDDSVDTQLLFKSQMKDFKLLKVCSNLTEALPFFSKYNFDLIVVDINLNDTYNGFDALKIIRQFKNYESTPIIAITAYPFEGDKEKFINFGFTDYFVKPILRERLVKFLEQTPI